MRHRVRTVLHLRLLPSRHCPSPESLVKGTLPERRSRNPSRTPVHDFSEIAVPDLLPVRELPKSCPGISATRNVTPSTPGAPSFARQRW